MVDFLDIGRARFTRAAFRSSVTYIPWRENLKPRYSNSGAAKMHLLRLTLTPLPARRLTVSVISKQCSYKVPKLERRRSSE